MYFVSKLKLGVSDQLQLLSRAAGKLYSVFGGLFARKVFG